MGKLKEDGGVERTAVSRIIGDLFAYFIRETKSHPRRPGLEGGVSPSSPD